MNDNEFMEIAISEAKISEKIGEIPVGAVILDSHGNITEATISVKLKECVS